MKVATYVFQAVAMVFCIALLFSPHQPGPMVTHPLTTIGLAAVCALVIGYTMRRVYALCDYIAKRLDKRNTGFSLLSVLFVVLAAVMLYMTPGAIIWLLSLVAAPVVVAHDSLWMAGMMLMMVDLLLGEITGQRVLFPAPRRKYDDDENDDEPSAPRA